MVSHKVKDMLSLEPNLCFPTGWSQVIGTNSTSCQANSHEKSLKRDFVRLGNKGLVKTVNYSENTK